MSELKLESGKSYRTRDGRKATILAIVPPAPFGSLTRPVHGWIAGYHEVVTWRLDGRYVAPAYDNPIDLISEWRDPPTALDVVKAVTRDG